MSLLEARRKVLDALDAAALVKATEMDKHMVKEMAALCDGLDKMYKQLSELDGHAMAVPDGPES